MKSFVTAIATFAATTCLAPLSAQAAPVSFLNQTIVARIPARDLPAFRAAVGQALNDSADGASTQWTSSPGRGHQPVQVTLMPQQTTQTDKAGRCRLLAAQVRQLSVSEDWRFWFCQQPGGQWMASGSQLR
ncbi:MAG: hypothetical protein LBI66_13440 [Burkholderiaceae bacterium]|jgi:hypothetical protein|nr:hypothetical protein [Burkholderiaceae bacterium]